MGDGETVIGGRVGYEGRFLRVRVDQVRLPSGRVSHREVVEHPGAVAIVATTADGDLLLVRQYRHAAGRELLELPAGTREAGEPADVTARRELIEETGYAAGALVEIASFYPTPGYSAEQITLFRATNCQPVDREEQADEPARLEIVPRAGIERLLTSEDRVEDGKTLIGLLWLSRESSGPSPRR